MEYLNNFILDFLPSAYGVRVRDVWVCQEGTQFPFIVKYHHIDRIEYLKLGISQALAARGLRDCYVLNVYHSDDNGHRSGNAIPVGELVKNHTDGNSEFSPLWFDLPAVTPQAIVIRGNGNGGSRTSSTSSGSTGYFEAHQGSLQP